MLRIPTLGTVRRYHHQTSSTAMCQDPTDTNEEVLWIWESERITAHARRINDDAMGSFVARLLA